MSALDDLDDLDDLGHLDARLPTTRPAGLLGGVLR